MSQQLKYPEKVNIYNLKSFFNYKSLSISQITPGMIISFSYRSPEGVHDKAPLIYVIEAEQDRVWGINLHYKFALLGEAIQIKRAELQKDYPPAQEKKETEQTPIQPTDNYKPRPEQLNQKYIPSLPEFKETLKPTADPKPKGPVKKTTPPLQLLEKFVLSSQPKEFLRNYLYTRMGSLQKLEFKVLQ